MTASTCVYEEDGVERVRLGMECGYVMSLLG